jgi:hypothetical protein
MRKCWTCNGEHDLDAPCQMSAMNRSRIAAGGKPDLFDDVTDGPAFGPTFTATYQSDDECCGDGIEEGQSVRADGQGGWIHASAECERLAGA